MEQNTTNLKNEQSGTNPEKSPWLIAAWPGMGNVAIIAAGYLIHQLKMKQIARLPSRGHFDISGVSVKGGIVGPARLPRGMFFEWKNPTGRDLIVFLGEAQPSAGTYAYANELLEAATRLGVDRVVTFASIASGLRPGESPKVTGVATDTESLAALTRAEVEPLGDGQIGGLNGVLLGACAARGIPGVCLLAEIPGFAAAVPNPKAARAALSVFSVLSGIDVSLAELNKHAVAMDKAMLDALERAEHQQEEGEGSEFGESAEQEEAEAMESAGDAVRHDSQEDRPELMEPKLEAAVRGEIDRLFDDARRDPSKTGSLKRELDRLGLFKKYENRFLDLFRRAG